MSNITSAPIEFQILTNGQSRFWCNSRNKLFHFQLANKLQGEWSYNFHCLICDLSPKQILDIQDKVVESNLDEAVLRTDLLIEQTLDKNYRPVNSNIFAKRVSKVISKQLTLA